MKKNKNQQLMEQGEQSQVRLSSAESRQKKAKGQYMQANKDWLVAKSKEDGVKSLPKGIFYKVLAEGDATSATPTPSSVITAHYTGKTIDGATFELDHRHAADAHRRPMGGLYSRRNGLREVLPTRHPRRLHPHFRH